MASPQEWYSDGFFISCSDVQCFVKIMGSGKPVFCLHAFPTSSYDYSRVAPFLSDEFQLIFLDYPGFGYSAKPRDYGYSLLRYADVVQKVAHHLSLDRIYLLGHDIGDSIALELLKRGRPVIEKLVLMNGSIFSIPFDDLWMRLSQKLWLNPLTGSLISRLRLFRKPLFSQMLSRTFARLLSPDEIDAFWSLVRKNNGLGIYHRLMGYMPERWQHQQEWLDTLAVHPAHLTLIWGQADPIATPAVAEKALAHRPDARYVKLPRIGHYPHWDAAELVAQVVIEAFST